MAEKFKAAQPKGSTGKRLTILSIDGGGVRGIIPTIQLIELENKLQVKQIFFENKISELVCIIPIQQLIIRKMHSTSCYICMFFTSCRESSSAD
jgi:hypothetical protein